MHSPKAGSLARALARNEAHRCEVADCHRGRFKLGRFCKDHAQTYIRTGHPIARDIRRYAWRPLVLRSHAFVVGQLRAGHPSIEAAVCWVAKELEHAQRPTLYQPAYLGYASFLLRANREGVSPSDFVARAVASYLADDRGREVGPRFASDEHFAHQAAKLYLKPAHFSRAGWSRRKREPQDALEVVRPRWRVRAFTHERVTLALGVLALKASDAIRKQDH